MATNTYVALDKVTVGTATPSITFSSISASYTDLVIVGQYGSTVTEDYLRMQFNSDTTTNYSSTRIDGNGSSARSTRTANQNYVTLDWNSSCENALTKMTRVNIMNYANTTTSKTVLVRGDRATATTPTYTGTEAMVSLWRKTPEAITSIVLTMQTGNIAVGSTFSLYGIKAWADETTPKATGGYVYSDSTYWYHAFPFSSTFTPNQSLTCDYLVVAGGGGGGNAFSNGSDGAGGGGAGGLRSTVTATGGGGSLESALSLTAQAYTVTIGAGGAGGTTDNRGTNGSNSVFSTITSTGGGGGGGIAGGQQTGATGGSGGGGGCFAVAGGAGTANQGYAGGAGAGNGTAGGGGAGAVGANGVGNSQNGGNGGIGVQITALATTTGTGANSGYYAGGGGGAADTGGGTAGTGGLGGGGVGFTGPTTAAVAGTANTGGGGGGGGAPDAQSVGGAGGSGIVIVRYAK